MVAPASVPILRARGVTASSVISLSFPLSGRCLPADMGYAIYAAMSRICEPLHGLEGLQVATVRCSVNRNGMVELPRHAALELRVPAEHLPLVLGLAGRQLELNQQDHRHQVHSSVVTLGIPLVQSLEQVAGGTDRLYLRHVCFKVRDRQTDRLLTDTNEGFWPRWSRCLQRQLEARCITPAAALVDIDDQGRPFSRRVRAGSGYVTTVGVTLTGLNPDAVQTLLAQGLGGKQRLGCGVAVVPSRVFAG